MRAMSCGVPLTGGEEGRGEVGRRRVVEARVDGDLDEGAAGGAVVDREPGDEPAVGVVDEDLAPRPRADPDEQPEDAVGVGCAAALRGPLVRGEELGDGAGVVGVGDPGGEGLREPVDRPRRSRSRAPLSHPAP